MPRRFDLSSRATGCEKRVKIHWCSSGFIPRLLVILFITEGAEHTEKMIKDMFYLLSFSVWREAPRCTLWFKMIL